LLQSKKKFSVMIYRILWMSRLQSRKAEEALLSLAAQRARKESTRRANF
jgi:hypothetical protein